MGSVLKEILNWSEVWALLIPLAVLLFTKPKGDWVKPIKLYLLVAFVINLICDLIWRRIDLGLEDWMFNTFPGFYNSKKEFANTILYNIHSIVRFFLFAWFFHYQFKIHRILNKILVPLFIIIATITFGFYQDIRDFSSIIMATEAALLLVYCIAFYLIMLRDENTTVKTNPSFWVVTGLSIYCVINFPIFLFYTALAKQAEEFSIDIWDLHNICFIVLCCFIAKSFYAASTRH